MVKVDRLPSGSYRARVHLGDGKYKTFTGKSRKDVQLKAAEFEAGLAAEPEQEQVPLTLYNAITQYMEVKRNVLSPSTLCGYEQIQRNNLKQLMAMNIYEIVQDDVQREVNTMSVTLSAKSVRNAHGLLSTVLKYYRPNFNLNTTLPKRQSKKIIIPTESEVKQLYDYFGGTDMQVPFALGAVCGLRESEIMGLRWDCVDLESGTALIKEAIVRVKHGYAKKGPKSDSGYREIRLFPSVIELLRSEPRDGEYVTKLTSSAMYKRLYRALIKFEIPHYRFHDLRHYAVSVMIALGIPLPYIVHYFGHKDETMVRNVYGHIMARKKTEVDDLVQDYFEKNILKSVTKSVT